MMTEFLLSRLDIQENIINVLDYWHCSNSTIEELFTFIFKMSVLENAEFVKLFEEDRSFVELKSIYERNFIFELNLDELHLLSGYRHTVGSVIEFPPPIDVLVNNFEDLWSPKDKLSHGARALSKHFHRSTSGWYGMEANHFHGGAEAKNALARDVLSKILANSVWWNIHKLPHDKIVVEVRVKEGYGCRWELNGLFRGFLEPMMENGHEKGWVH